MGKSVTRLYSQFQPERYELALTLDKAHMTFGGTVTIRGRKVGRPSQRITLHQNGLKITSATVIKHDKKGEQELPLARINNHDSLQEVRLHASQMVYPGMYTLTVAFEGKITDSMTGIYPCYFKDGPADKTLLMTQFESHYARQAFPCIDEPEAKATFDLTLTTEAGITVLANTPVKTQQKHGDRLRTTFETTPKMSSYLLAFVAGELQSKSATTTSGVAVNVWATAAQPAQALEFPLEIAKRSIEYFEDYFGVPYPLAKVDHVACPDFSAGAMENWGLITYRERALLAYPGQTGQSSLELIATVIAHETSHQWFGDLVTMKWWNDLWLNESFANMMEYQAVDALHPEWHVWDSFIAQEGLGALRRDATPGVQSVKTEVRHPDEINTLFDPSIVYAKGGRLLYMLKNYIGEDAFRKGLSSYFQKHRCGNTEGADLWAALSAASGKDVGAFMDPWLEQSGFPVVSITQAGRELTIAQEHFLDNPAKADPDRRWPVPLFATAPGLPDSFDSSEIALSVPNDDIVLLDTHARGHYIVRYTSDKQKQAVADKIRTQKLGEADRLMLLNGGSMLARAGYEPYSNILAMLSAYRDEASEPVWDMMSLVIGETRRFIDLDESLEDMIKQLIRTLIAKQHKRLSWQEQTGESSADQKLRATIIGLGAYAEEPAIVSRALELFESYKSKPDTVPAELRGIVFAVAVKQHTPGALTYLLQLHDSTNNSELKGDICGALTATHLPEEAEKLLGRLQDAKLVKPQDADRWLVYLLRNRYACDTAWQWMTANWAWIEQTYHDDKSYDMLPRYAASIVNTAAWAKRYREFFEPKAGQLVLQRNIAMGLEEITARVAWLTRDLTGVQKFFNTLSGS
ncbi:MAG TPA: M1 family metallopeptidase [Candidatus Saccharimonadales bacterium]